MKKVAFLIVAFFAALSLFAQTLPPKDTLSSPIPEDIQALRTAFKLAEYGYKNDAASALVEAAIIINANQTQELEVGAGSTESRDIAPNSGVSFDPKQLIADAKEMAGRDKELQAYITKVEKTIGKAKRGAIGGPFIKTSMVLPFATDKYFVRFAGQRKANVILEGTDISDLDLYVYDENENLICYDDDYTSECAVSFTPRWDGYFIICVVNNAILPNPYLLCTN